MISPKRYSWSFDGEMKESLDGDFIDASDYYNMTEKLKGDIAKAGVKAVKRFNPEINDLKSRITELQSQLEKQSDIIKALEGKSEELTDIQKKCYGLVKGMAVDDFTYGEVYRILFMIVGDFLMEGEVKPN